MATNIYNFEVYKGSTHTVQLTIRDTDDALFNLTDYQARGMVRFNYSDPTPLLVLNPTIDPSLVSGLINITIPATGTALLPVTTALYDIEIYTTGGSVNKALIGTFSIFPEATY